MIPLVMTPMQGYQIGEIVRITEVLVFLSCFKGSCLNEAVYDKKKALNSSH